MGPWWAVRKLFVTVIRVRGGSFQNLDGMKNAAAGWPASGWDLWTGCGPWRLDGDWMGSTRLGAVG